MTRLSVSCGAVALLSLLAEVGLAADAQKMARSASGFLQNCNSTPLRMTDEGNPDPARYPPNMVPEQDNGRARVSRRILASRSKWTFDEWARAAFDTTVISAAPESEADKVLGTLTGLAEPLVARISVSAYA